MPIENTEELEQKIVDLQNQINDLKPFIFKDEYSNLSVFDKPIQINAGLNNLQGTLINPAGQFTIGDTSTISGRIASILAAAIDASGHFADSAINTATSTIITPFNFGASGALQIGTYENGVTGDVRISPAGILGRDKLGATTFSINGTTGVAVLNGLVVGTNVGLGTAQDSGGVTTIVGNVVTTGFVNALSVVAGSVAAENISGTYITGKTIRTAASGARVQMDSSNYFQCYDASYLRIKLDTTNLRFYQSGTEIGGIYNSSAGILQIYTITGTSLWLQAPTVVNDDFTADAITKLTGKLQIPVGTDLY